VALLNRFAPYYILGLIIILYSTVQIIDVIARVFHEIDKFSFLDNDTTIILQYSSRKNSFFFLPFHQRLAFFPRIFLFNFVFFNLNVRSHDLYPFVLCGTERLQLDTRAAQTCADNIRPAAVRFFNQ